MTKLITIQCETCKGTGLVTTTELFRGKRVTCGVLCVDCNGNGETSFEWVCCEHCGDPVCCGECLETSAPTPEPVAAGVVYNGGVVDAYGFTTRTFTAGVRKAQKIGTLHMELMRNGVVRVDTGRTGHVYMVSRNHCDCPAGQSHGYCYHRAAVTFVHDVCGIDFKTAGLILGFDERGNPVTAEERKRQLAEAQLAAA